MKNKKATTYLVILALVLTLSVGYAVISAVDMTISGSAAATTEDLNVEFISATTSNEEKITAGINTNSLTANIRVTSISLNETLTATYTIKNNETDVDALIKTTEIINSNSEYFEVTTDAATEKSITAGATTTVTVSVKLIKTPVTETQNTTTITINLEARPMDNKTTN